MNHQKILTTTAKQLTNSTGYWYGPLDVLTALWRCDDVTIAWSRVDGLAIEGATQQTVAASLARAGDCPAIASFTLRLALVAGLHTAFGPEGGSLRVRRGLEGCEITARRFSEAVAA